MESFSFSIFTLSQTIVYLPQSFLHPLRSVQEEIFLFPEWLYSIPRSFVVSLKTIFVVVVVAYLFLKKDQKLRLFQEIISK